MRSERLAYNMKPELIIFLEFIHFLDVHRSLFHQQIYFSCIIMQGSRKTCLEMIDMRGIGLGCKCDLSNR